MLRNEVHFPECRTEERFLGFFYTSTVHFSEWTGRLSNILLIDFQTK